MAATTTALRLRVADSFRLRLPGVHAIGTLAPDEGLVLVPCRAVHTFFLRQALDVVFLDARGGECRCVHSLPPYRVAGAAGARMVVELSAGYCRRHPDYLDRVHIGLRTAGIYAMASG
ncbi:DUF192 domain-containing protein [Alcaligenaceae bacterium]|nr:DUF192 domain-containing protein [Alcaligenaceae bacterium]